MANLWILNQFHKCNKSCITDASVIKLNNIAVLRLDIIVLKSMKFHYIVA